MLTYTRTHSPIPNEKVTQAGRQFIFNIYLYICSWMLLFMDHRLHLIILKSEQHSVAYSAKMSTIWIFHWIPQFRCRISIYATWNVRSYLFLQQLILLLQYWESLNSHCNVNEFNLYVRLWIYFDLCTCIEVVVTILNWNHKMNRTQRHLINSKMKWNNQKLSLHFA